MIFRGRKKVIFVHGCFWHRHDGCPLARSVGLLDSKIGRQQGT
ncbi:hypothetical protein [Edaphovirga cremea]